MPLLPEKLRDRVLKDSKGRVLFEAKAKADHEWMLSVYGFAPSSYKQPTRFHVVRQFLDKEERAVVDAALPRAERQRVLTTLCDLVAMRLGVGYVHVSEPPKGGWK